MIQIGQPFPSTALWSVTEATKSQLNFTDEIHNKTVLVVGVPGAFTPVCSTTHVPEFLNHAEQISELGIDKTYVFSVNDPFVMQAWAKSLGTRETLTFLCDGNGEATRALGLDLDGTSSGLGPRCQRFCLLIKNGLIDKISVEPNVAACSLTSAETFIADLKTGK